MSTVRQILKPHKSHNYRINSYCRNFFLYKQVCDIDKQFNSLDISKSLAFTVPLNSHNLRAHAGFSKTYLYIKGDFYWDIDKWGSKSPHL